MIFKTIAILQFTLASFYCKNFKFSTHAILSVQNLVTKTPLNQGSSPNWRSYVSLCWTGRSSKSDYYLGSTDSALKCLELRDKPKFLGMHAILHACQVFFSRDYKTVVVMILVHRKVSSSRTALCTWVRKWLANGKLTCQKKLLLVLK